MKIAGLSNNIIMTPLGSIHIGMGDGDPNGEILYVSKKDQVFSNGVLNGVDIGSLWTNTDNGHQYFNSGGISLKSADWTIIESLPITLKWYHNLLNWLRKFIKKITKGKK